MFRGVHFFSGGLPRPDGISGWAHMMGGAVSDVDTATGGAAHNLRRVPVLHRWQRTLRSGEVDVAYFGGPCGTFSPRHVPQLRSVHEPAGMLLMPPEWRAHVLAANELWDGVALLARELFAAGGEFVVEFPQRRYLRHTRAYWPKMAARGICSPGDLQSILDLERDCGAARVDIRQCALGGRFQKFTTLLCSPRIAQELDFLQDLPCDLCDRFVPHQERATGVFPDGSSRAAAAAAYPSELNRVLAAAGAACPRGPRRGPPPAQGLPCLGPPPLAGDLDPASEDGMSDGLSDASDSSQAAAPVGPGPEAPPSQVHGAGSVAGDAPYGIAAGPGLPGNVRARVEAARAAPHRFASLRNLASATPEELAAASIPSQPVVRSDLRPAPTAAAWGDQLVGPQDQRPSGPIALHQLFMPGVFQRVEDWRTAAELALRCIAEGKPARPPPTLTIPQRQLQPWARGLVWDTRQPRDCHPVTPTSADTPDVCESSINRHRLRAEAERLGWPDHDIIGQSGRGGVESRSDCSADTVLSFHHSGISDHFSAVDKVVRDDAAAGWVLGDFFSIPFVPCRSLPRNVVLQARSRVVAGGEVEDYDKLRVTTNLSDGEDQLGYEGDAPLAVNEGVPFSERTMELPTVRQLGAGASVVGEAGRGDGLRAELYCFDLRSAFRFAPIQRRDWWQHVFLWLSSDGRAVWMIDAHGAFGGAYMPQRFERLTTLGMALAREAQDAFDAAHPYPPGVRAWQQARAQLQRDGALPPGPEQLRPAYSHIYLDDGAGAALNDTVPVPPELLHIPLGALATRTLGGVPSASDSRAAVHLRIAIGRFEFLGFQHESTKTECGSAIVNLGFRVRADAARIDCPLPKRRILLRDLSELRRAVDAHEALPQASVERLTGRLAHLSHVLPEVAPHLAGGYAVASATVRLARRPRRSRVGSVRLRQGGRCEEAVRAMCDVASQLLTANDGIALAAAECFAAVGSAGSLTTVTDASGEDGVGGYAFLPLAPHAVWVLADEWPPDVRSALAFAAQPRAERLSSQGASACSMPLAELFGPWAMAAAVADHISAATAFWDRWFASSGMQAPPPGAGRVQLARFYAQAFPAFESSVPELPPEAVRSLVAVLRAVLPSAGGRAAAQFRSVISVVDCAPAATVLSSATSAGAQLRSLVAAAREDVTQWLGAAVPREWNTDADVLSHPSRWREVAAAAEANGLLVHRVHAPLRCWSGLRSAMALPMGREAAAWREAGEVVASAPLGLRHGRRRASAAASRSPLAHDLIPPSAPLSGRFGRAGLPDYLRVLHTQVSRPFVRLDPLRSPAWLALSTGRPPPPTPHARHAGQGGASRDARSSPLGAVPSPALWLAGEGLRARASLPKLLGRPFPASPTGVCATARAGRSPPAPRRSSRAGSAVAPVRRRAPRTPQTPLYSPRPLSRPNLVMVGGRLGRSRQPPSCGGRPLTGALRRGARP